jgi:hypothetical protein
MRISEEDFNNLPNDLILRSAKVAHLELQVVREQKRLATAADAMSKQREVVENVLEELNIARIELKDACQKHAEENL